MEAYTLTKRFQRDESVDAFDSLIWTERYYGDSEVEIKLPATRTNIALLKEGKFLQLVGSDEVMSLETHNMEDGILTVSGISLLPWMNNRPLRNSGAHEDRYWNIQGFTAEQTLSHIVTEMLIYPGPMGIPDPSTFVIEGLIAPLADSDDATITVAAPFGPLFDALYQIATLHEVGQKITLESVDPTSYQLRYSSYKGLDRTSSQTPVNNEPANPIVRFSPDMEALTDIKEFRSMAGYKTVVYSWAPANPGSLATDPGIASISYLFVPGETSPFDLRVTQVFAEDITTDLVGGSAVTMQNLLNARAEEALSNSSYVAQVDGEIVPTSQFRYGRDYGLGDIIEIAGHSGIIQPARVTEYIRSQDASGEKAYPGVTLIV